jgi:3-oxoacyl-(acyl-carrier-protein) synthase
LQFFGEYAQLADASIFAKWLSPMGKCVPVRTMLSNSFAFGGTNAVLVLRTAS